MGSIAPSSTPTGRLAGRVAIVTGKSMHLGLFPSSLNIRAGGGSGFGAATSLLFASEGAHVLIADMNDEAAKKIAAKASSNGSITFQKANVTSRQSWEELIARIDKDFAGRLDIVVNNAGTSYPWKQTLEVTEEDYDMTMNVNCKSIFWSVKVCVPAMLKTGRGGAFVNTASIGGSRPRPGLVWYAASKGTVINVSTPPNGEA